MRHPTSPAIARAALVACSVFGLCSLSPGADEAGKGETPAAGGTTVGGVWTPSLRAASDAAERAIDRMKVPADLKISLWAAEPMLGDPNAIHIDEKGRVYVAETYRYHGGTIDIRAAMGWLEEELASKTVEERLAIPPRHANEAPGKEALLSRDSERIVLLQDTTGSGRADKSTVFTTGYDQVKDGLGSGVFAYHGSVYYTCIPSLYLLKDTNGDGKADEKKELQYGYGVRYGFLGHDLHGMILGPDGRLYFSIGDRGANVTKTPDGRHVENTESGCVFRCDLDGTNLELFATGLRNPQELQFDQYGNLFTGDNNPDKGDPARWVYVIEDGDTGWRVGYQHATHMANGGPWMAEQLWSPEANNNATYHVPNVTPLYDGPSGLAYYPGTGLPDRYENHFFLCDFRGASQTSRINSFAMKPKGASFELVDLKPFMEHICATDCDFGPDGAMYVSDWVDGWARPMAGRIYKVYDPTKTDDALVKETKKIIGDGMTARSPEELVKLLGHRDMRVRQEAQFALAGKGAASIPAFTAVAQKGDNLVTRLHGIWGLGQIARKSPEALNAVLPLLSDKELEVRCQAARVLGDGKAAAYEPIVKMLADSELRARFFAAQTLSKLGRKEAVPALFTALKENNDEDAVLRFACVTALSKLADAPALTAKAGDDSRAVRLGAALALRRQSSPDIATFLNDKDAQIVLETARAINDLPIPAALPQLAGLLDKTLPAAAAKAEKPPYTLRGPRPTGTPGDWILWRAVNAGFRLGTPEAAKALAAFAAKNDAPAAVRVEALNDLGEWARPNNLDHITTLYRPLTPRDPKAARDAAAAVVAGIVQDAPADVKQAAANLMRTYGLGDAATLAATVTDAKAPPEVRVAALSSLADRKDARLADVVQAVLKDPNKVDAVRAEAIRLLGTQAGGVAQIAGLLDTGSTRDKQAVLAALGGSEGTAADPILAKWLDQLNAKQVPPELHLELLEAAGKRKDAAAVVTKLAQFETARDANDTIGSFRESLTGGDVDRGRRIFRERADVSCIRCHVAAGEGGTVGPPLDGVGAKQTRDYLLESIIAPNAKIAPGFESVVVQTTENKYRTGVVKKDDDKELVLLNPDLEPGMQVMTIPKTQIKSRDRGPSAMPEGLHRTLTKAELRDLVEFLASLKEVPKEQPKK